MALRSLIAELYRRWPLLFILVPLLLAYAGYVAYVNGWFTDSEVEREEKLLLTHYLDDMDGLVKDLDSALWTNNWDSYKLDEDRFVSLSERLGEMNAPYGELSRRHSGLRRALNSYVSKRKSADYHLEHGYGVYAARYRRDIPEINLSCGIAIHYNGDPKERLFEEYGMRYPTIWTTRADWACWMASDADNFLRYALRDVKVILRSERYLLEQR